MHLYAETLRSRQNNSERRVRTIQRVCHFIKAVIRLTWAITHLKKKKCTREVQAIRLSEARDESASAEQESGTSQQTCES